MGFQSKKITNFSIQSVAIGLIILGVNLYLSLRFHHDFLDILLNRTTDSLGYYQYLPAIFIEHDLTNLLYGVRLENGNMLSVFHIGTAILQLPFFLLGHAYTWLTGGELTGYSSAYAVAQIIGASVYIGLAMMMLFKILRQHFTGLISSMVILYLYYGTNLLFYSVRENGMSHVYSFFLFSVLMFFTHVFEEKRNYQNALILSLTSIIIILIKPNNGVILFYFLFFGVTNWDSFIARLQKVFLPISTWVVAVVAALGLLGLQIGYWHLVSGEYIVFSYGAIGEGFNWLNPEFFKVLFSPQNGWFIYSPIVIMPFIGLLYLTVKNQYNARVSLVIWMLAWYVFSSWWAWWFGAAFGHRAFVEYLPLLAVPFGYALTYLKNSQPVLFYITNLIMLFFVWLNYGMSFEYYAPWDGPDWGWDDYQRVALKSLKRFL